MAITHGCLISSALFAQFMWYEIHCHTVAFWLHARQRCWGSITTGLFTQHQSFFEIVFPKHICLLLSGSCITDGIQQSMFFTMCFQASAIKHVLWKATSWIQCCFSGFFSHPYSSILFNLIIERMKSLCSYECSSRVFQVLYSFAVFLVLTVGMITTFKRTTVCTNCCLSYILCGSQFYFIFY